MGKGGEPHSEQKRKGPSGSHCHTLGTGPSPPFLDVCHMTVNCHVTTDEDRWFWSKRLVLIYLPRKVSLGGSKGHTNIQISAEQGSSWGPCGQKAATLLLRQPLPPAIE